MNDSNENDVIQVEGYHNKIMETKYFNIEMTEFLTPNLSFSKTEMFDVNMAKYITAQSIDSEDKKKIQKMLKNKERGCYLNIHYILGKASKQNAYGKKFLGRIMPMGNYGLQTLSGDIRRALSKPFYWDLDIVNAQGEILNQMAQMNGWSNTYLTELCINRDAIFEDIMKESNINRSQVKVIFLSLFFGGACYENYSSWIKEKFYPEIEAMMINLSNMYPTLKTDCEKKKKQNALGSCCAIILQTEERKCLVCLDRFLSINGRSMDTFIHDGGLVLKLKDETEFPPLLIKQAEQYLLDNTGYTLKLLTKSMESTFKLPINITDDKTYIGVKGEFEKRVFLCIGESCFYWIYERDVKIFSKSDLITSYQGSKYSEIIDGVVKEFSFIKKWLDDDSKRKFVYVDTVIPPLECPDDTYNLWDGLEIENFKNEERDYTEDIAFIKGHVKLLCGDDEALFQYVIKWMAFMFQHPSDRNNVAIIFKSSQQGMGKNLCFTTLANMMGSKYAKSIAKAERDVFGTFNGLLENKLFIHFEEFSGKCGFKYDSELKNFITGDDIDIMKKGVDATPRPNRLKVIFSTNNDYPVKIEAGDRRFVICDSSRMAIPSKEYFDNLVRINANKNILRAFYDELMDIDLSSVDWIRDRPATEAYNDMRMASLDVEIRFLLDFIDGKTGITKIPSKTFYEEFQNFTLIDGLEYRTNNIKFAIKIKNYSIDGLTIIKGNTCNYNILDCNKIRIWLISKGFLQPEMERLLSP